MTVLMYTVAAWLTFRTFIRVRAASDLRREARLWAAFSVVMLLLGLNKQLDLQTLFTEIGRNMAYAEGWYENRRAVQFVFVAWVGALAIVGNIALLFTVYRMPISTRLATLGMTMIVAFVAVRAASFHHVDLILYARLGGLRLNTLLEFGGIATVQIGALLRLRTMTTQAATEETPASTQTRRPQAGR